MMIEQKMKKLEHTILADGEVTGHSHRAGNDASLWSDGSTILMDAPRGTTVMHEEHKQITVPPGRYVRKIVQEYDHALEESREVRD